METSFPLVRQNAIVLPQIGMNSGTNNVPTQITTFTDNMLNESFEFIDFVNFKSEAQNHKGQFEIYDTCDYPDCINMYEKKSKKVVCKGCKRTIDLCSHHKSLPEKCVFCLDEDSLDNQLQYELELDESEELEPESEVNRCLECGVDLGRYNPRQYCGKIYCENKKYW